MKEKPIPFSGPMVIKLPPRGPKTQTRRMNGLKVINENPGWWSVFRETGEAGPWRFITKAGVIRSIKCPYGEPGDALWVREHFRLETLCEDIPASCIGGATVQYEADGEVRGEQIDGFGRLRVGMFMPRWASRITLRITDVRVERLNDISEADALAEGCSPSDPITKADIEEMEDGPAKELGHLMVGGNFTAKLDYMGLWDSINGDGAFAKNPWVWVVSFERIPQPEAS